MLSKLERKELNTLARELAIRLLVLATGTQRSFFRSAFSNRAQGYRPDTK